MTTYTIYGASDDILVIEKDGKAVEEYYVDGDDKAAVIIMAPGYDFSEAKIIAHFSDSGWRLILSEIFQDPDGTGHWEFVAHNRPDHEDDPALSIICPDGSTFVEANV